MNITTIAAELIPESTIKLKHELKSAEARRRAMALVSVAPLAIFLLLIFVVPIDVPLTRAVQNPEVADAPLKTIIALKDWDRKSPPASAARAALAADFTTVNEGEAMGVLTRRLNTEVPGFRPLVAKTVRAMPLADDQGKASTLTLGQVRVKLLEIDERWGDVTYRRAIVKNSNRMPPFCLLAALDHRQDIFGHIEATNPDEQIYVAVFLHTFVINVMVTLFTLLLSYPLSYWVASLPERRTNLIMVIVLIPFWTFILVRVVMWVVLLQTEGLINHGLIDLSIIKGPLVLLFNRVGAYISMTHILLSFMILPLYSMMKSIPVTYQHVAVSLGSRPFTALWRVYVPQTYPGISASALLVFTLTLGYYITPVLLGGSSGQTVSYYMVCFTSIAISQGVTCTLGVLLSLAMLVLYAVYGRFTRPKVRAG